MSGGKRQSVATIQSGTGSLAFATSTRACSTSSEAMIRSASDAAGARRESPMMRSWTREPMIGLGVSLPNAPIACNARFSSMTSMKGRRSS